MLVKCYAALFKLKLFTDIIYQGYIFNILYAFWNQSFIIWALWAGFLSEKNFSAEKH